MEKLTKQDIKGPDTFIKQASLVTKYAQTHKKQTLTGVIVVVILAIAWAGWGFYKDLQESKAQTEYYGVYKKLKTLDEKNTEQSLALATELSQIANKYPITQAANLSALDASRLYFNLNKNEEAIKLLEKASKSATNSSVKAISLANLATNYEAIGQWQKAIDTLNQIEAREDMGFLHGQSLLKKGLNFEKLGQKEQAIQMYRKAEGLSKYPDIVSTAKKYLRTL
ncbi:MAG: tetratricopeptide repeat protein [Oligoflexia bacterium]|nr:tetratricopeptide repeat protein [Oligoflexia bacterium]